MTAGARPATTVLVGEDSLDLAARHLRLGSVVVIAPDERTFRAWRYLGDPASGPGDEEVGTDELLRVDDRAHWITWRGEPLRLAELEFRVLSLLASQPDRAWSFSDLHESGWGERHQLRGHLHPLRSVVQRLRLALRDADVPAEIQSVRGFGFRLRYRPQTAAVLDLRDSKLTSSR